MATIRVTNQTELDVAVKAAKGGDTVVLAAGKYNQLWVDNKISTSAITFKSESATNPAVIGYVRAIGSDGVLFQDLKIGRQMVVGVDQDWTNMALVQDSKNVSFSGVQFFSTGSDDKYLGRGIFVRSSSNVSVKGSDFSHLSVAMQSMTVDGLIVQNNKFHDLRIDGAEFTAVKNVLIDGNDFRDFRSSELYHPDAIQFWTNGTKQASSDIVISNNVIMPGTGAGSQGIFIQDEVGGLPYERVTIKNNLLLDAGNYWNGITVRGGKDIVLENNTSISPTSDSKNFFFRLDNVVGAKLINNLADQLVQSGSSGLTLTGNVFLNEQPKFASKISGINLGSSATISSLIVSGVGYQSSSTTSTTSTTTPTTTTTALTPVATSPISQVAASSVSDTSSTTSATSGTTTTSTSSSLTLTALQPTTLASTLTPIATTTTTTAPVASVTTNGASAPATTTTTVAAPVLSAKQQKAAAKAAAAAAKAKAKAAAAAAKAAAKAAKSSKTGTAVAVAPVVSQPIIPVAAAPIASVSSIGSSAYFTNGADYLTGAL